MEQKRMGPQTKEATLNHHFSSDFFAGASSEADVCNRHMFFKDFYQVLLPPAPHIRDF